MCNMKVQLRKKKQSDGAESLYLDLYDKGQRSYEFLDLKLVKPKSSADRQANREVFELSCKIRAKREHELNNEIFRNRKAIFSIKESFEIFDMKFTVLCS